MVRFCIERTDKNIFKLLAKPGFDKYDFFKKQLYGFMKNLYKDAPILNTVRFINEIGSSKDFINEVHFLITDKRQEEKIKELILTDTIECKYHYVENNIYEYINKNITNYTFFISDDIKTIKEMSEKNINKNFMIPITGYTCKKENDEYLLLDNTIEIYSFTNLNTVTLFESFDFKEEHLAVG